MLKPRQNVCSVLDSAVGCSSGHVGDEADTASIPLIARIVQPLLRMLSIEVDRHPFSLIKHRKCCERGAICVSVTYLEQQKQAVPTKQLGLFAHEVLP